MGHMTISCPGLKCIFLKIQLTVEMSSLGVQIWMMACLKEQIELFSIKIRNHYLDPKMVFFSIFADF